MARLCGLETEYGIQVDGDEGADVVVESMELVRACVAGAFVARWDYRLENPRRDVRGFVAGSLRNEEDEAAYGARDGQRSIPLPELKSDLVLANGGRLYNDHTHPEYSTPECRGLLDLVAADRAGEELLHRGAGRRTAARGLGRVRLFRNNTDFAGHSYGCHENYLLDRKIPFDAVVEGLLAHLVTRQICWGAGKVGVEGPAAPADGVHYQLSQRADFLETVAGIDTMERRPLVNTRDEPHADPRRYRRLHLIAGDANMAEYATALKVGTTALVLDLLEIGALEPVSLADPVAACRSISRAPDGPWAVALADGRRTSALEVQQDLADQASRRFSGRDEETDWVLREWAWTLAALAAGRREELVGRLDWVTKRWLLDTFVEVEGLDWERPQDRAWLQAQDLEYHSIDPAEGLFRLLEGQGGALRLIDDERVSTAAILGPADTRARFRGQCVARFGEAVGTVGWAGLELSWDGQRQTVELEPDLEAARRYSRAIEVATTVAELAAAVRAEEGKR
ncbi:MAG: proteasome accessory factor PafA2 family protein [Candidatus Latescibacterota bacterium]|jgi:proteasome accessory factor A